MSTARPAALRVAYTQARSAEARIPGHGAVGATPRQRGRATGFTARALAEDEWEWFAAGNSGNHHTEPKIWGKVGIIPMSG